jgi:hypothetical protein
MKYAMSFAAPRREREPNVDPIVLKETMQLNATTETYLDVLGSALRAAQKSRGIVRL